MSEKQNGISFNERLGKSIKTARVLNRYTQNELADKVGITQSTLSSYECGNAAPSLETLCGISKTLKVSTDDLLDLTERMRPIKSYGDIYEFIFYLSMLVQKDIRFEVPERRWEHPFFSMSLGKTDRKPDGDYEIYDELIDMLTKYVDLYQDFINKKISFEDFNQIVYRNIEENKQFKLNYAQYDIDINKFKL